MTHDPSHGDAAELAANYAIGAMTSAELVWFDVHLKAGCLECLDELTKLGDVAGQLFAAVKPVTPDSLTRESLLRRVADHQNTNKESPLRPHLDPSGQVEGEMLITKRASESGWEPTAVPGVTVRVLAVDKAADQYSALVRMAAGATYPRHVHGGPEHCLVLEGDLHVGSEVLHAGDYQVALAGSTHGVQSTVNGCLLFIMSSLSDQFA